MCVVKVKVKVVILNYWWFGFQNLVVHLNGVRRAVKEREKYKKENGVIWDLECFRVYYIIQYVSLLT